MMVIVIIQSGSADPFGLVKFLHIHLVLLHLISSHPRSWNTRPRLQF